MAKQKVKQKPLKISWSAVSAFLSCQRKFELSYLENLQAIPSSNNRNLLLGSAVHAGIEAALLETWNNARADLIDPVAAAVKGVRQYMKEAVLVNKTTFDYVIKKFVPDHDYYLMTREVEQLAVELVRFHVPLIGIGTYILPTSIQDVLNNVPPHTTGDTTPAIEWRFEQDLGNNTILTGIIDTIVWDVQNEHYVLVDWKTRGSFPHPDLAMLDGQAHLYAAVVNEMALETSGKTPLFHVAMWQMRTKTPAPASISKVTGLPNTGGASYDTTWDYWVATLPAGIDPEYYRSVMQPKLKQPEDFQAVVMGLVTAQSSAAALDNVQAAAQAIREAILSNKALPAVLSSNACKFCDFTKLCMNTFRYGGNVADVLSQHYETKTGRSGSLDVAELEE